MVRFEGRAISNILRFGTIHQGELCDVSFKLVIAHQQPLQLIKLLKLDGNNLKLVQNPLVFRVKQHQVTVTRVHDTTYKVVVRCIVHVTVGC
jgi:hypothetical protein